MLDKICKTKKELLQEIKNKKDYLNNYEIMINDSGFRGDYFEQNLYYFLINNIKYYDIKTLNKFLDWFYSLDQDPYCLECPKNGHYQSIIKIEF